MVYFVSCRIVESYFPEENDITVNTIRKFDTENYQIILSKEPANVIRRNSIGS